MTEKDDSNMSKLEENNEFDSYSEEDSDITVFFGKYMGTLAALSNFKDVCLNTFPETIPLLEKLEYDINKLVMSNNPLSRKCAKITK